MHSQLFVHTQLSRVENARYVPSPNARRFPANLLSPSPLTASPWSSRVYDFPLSPRSALGTAFVVPTSARGNELFLSPRSALGTAFGPPPSTHGGGGESFLSPRALRFAPTGNGSKALPALPNGNLRSPDGEFPLSPYGSDSLSVDNASITPQAVGSKTFTPPPSLTGPRAISMPQIFDFHARHSPSHSFFMYEDSPGHKVNVTYLQFHRAMHRSARILKSYAEESKVENPVFAVLAAADSVTYVATMMAITRLGYRAFLCSPRNSAAAIAHLLTVTGTTNLLITHDPAMQKIAEGALEALKESEVPMFVHDHPRFEQLLPEGEHELLFEMVEELPPMVTPNLDEVAIILHSSGSTSFPKPINLTHRTLLQWGFSAWFGERDLCGELLACQSLALFHAMAVITPFWAATTGMTLAVFKPAMPATAPNPTNFLEAIISSESTMVFCVPSHIEAWSHSLQESLPALQRLKALLWCGGPMSKDVGDVLAANGVFITPFYASTETGGMSLFIPSASMGMDWEYFRLSDHTNPRLISQDDDSGAYEAVFLDCDSHSVSVRNHTLEGKDAYATSDLLIPHPSLPGFYKMYGRADDQIMLSTGEKTNPAPIEKILIKHPMVAQAVMFGRGRFQNGVILDPPTEHEFDPSDDAALAAYRKAVWPIFEEANTFAPSHSRIFREMILVSKKSKPFAFTPKGTPKRKVVLKDYEDEIEALYRTIEEADESSGSIAHPSVWDLEAITGFIRATVHKTLEKEIGDAEDIFEAGGDSLAATWIRNSILQALRKTANVSSAAIRMLPPDFVFSFPNIVTLSAFLFGFVLCWSAGPMVGGPAGSDEGFMEGDMRNTGSALVLTDADYENEEPFIWPGLGEGGNLIKLRRSRRGENPLIVLHGSGGTVHAFGPLQEKFRSALWVVQVTPDTPMETMGQQASWYVQKIKEELPSGPYRLGAFSATSIIAVAMAKLFEDAGDEVSQLAMLDHFPTMFYCPVYGLSNFDLADPVARRAFHAVCMEGICTALRNDGGGKVARRHELATNLWAAFNNEKTDTFTETYWRTVEKFLNMMVDFMMTQGQDEAVEGARSMEPLMQWIKTLKAPVTIYLASDGMIATLPEEYREEWWDLGTRLCFPNANLVPLTGGHFDILGDDKLIAGLQAGYL